MSDQNNQKMHDLTEGQSCKSVATVEILHDPIETVSVYGVSAINFESVARPPVVQGSCNISKFVSPSKVCELLDCAPSTVTRRCQSGKFKGAQKTLIDGTESWQIPITSLPPEAQAKLATERLAAIVVRAAALKPPVPAVQGNHAAIELRAMWSTYEQSGDATKKKAETLFAAVSMFEELTLQGFSKGHAEKAVRAAHGVSRQTLWRARGATNGHPVGEWLPRLSPNWSGGRPEAELSEDAWYWIQDAYLKQTKQPLAVVMENVRIEGRKRGWTIPSNDAVANRIKKLPDPLVKLGRYGIKALERNQFAIKRSYDMPLHRLWESDGHRADVMCIWPDGTVARPFVIVWREVRSRLILGVKGCANPSAEFSLSSFCMAVERSGTSPDYAKLDNGREYASKTVTGGQKNRYRFQVIEGEQIGVLTHMGVEVLWSEPGRGQDKPIEPWWKYGIDRADKHFDGAYCGKDVVSKPENFNAKNAVPIAVYEAKLAEIYERFNTEHSHSGDGMNDETPLEVYRRLSGITARQKVDPAHIRMCKMGATQITPGQGNVYTLKIPGYGYCRYHSEDIAKLPSYELSCKHNVYYHLEDPTKPISVYRGKAFLGDARFLENTPFLGAVEVAAEHKKHKQGTMKAVKDDLKQIKERANSDPRPALAAPSLGVLPQMVLTFDEKRKPPVIAAPVFDDPWEDTDKPGVQVHRETGKVRTDTFIAAVAAPVKKDSPTLDDTEQRQQQIEQRLREAEERRLQRELRTGTQN